jgi:predicted permease
MIRLPVLARWALFRYLPADEREFIVGDLEEEYDARGRSVASSWWLWRQVIGLLWSRGARPRGIVAMRHTRESIGHGIRLFTRDGLRQDIGLALRMLTRDKSFTIAALLTLTICIAANSAMFSIVRSVILKPLPFRDAERLVLLYQSFPKTGSSSSRGASVPNYFDRQTGVPALEDVAIYRGDTRRLGTGDGVEQVRSLRTTPSLMRLLRVQPVHGRLFADEDLQPGPPAVLLLTYEVWQRRFGGAPIVGQMVRLNETPTRVIGILPPGFSFLSNDIEIVEPLTFTAQQRADTQRYNGNHTMVGRLRPDATMAQAQAQVDALDARLMDRTPEFRQRLEDAGYRTVVASLQAELVSGVTDMLYLLWGGVGLVLVIGCVNVANLVTVRARSRSRELATRHALGADISQLARLLVCESVLLSLAGGVLGIWLGVWALDWIGALGVDQLPRGFEIAADFTGAFATLALTFVIGVVLGLVPTARLHRMDLNAELREESRGGTSGRRDSLARRAMATAQFATAFIVVGGAALLFTSFQAAMRVDLGFEPANVSTATVELPTAYRNPEAQSQYVRRTLAALQAMPEIAAAGVTTAVPYAGGVSTSRISSESQPGTLTEPILVTISPGYFKAMGVPIVAGRDLDDRDGAIGSEVRVVIDDRLAQTLWPGADAVGRRLYSPEYPNNPAKITPATKFLTVVGVAANMRFVRPRTGITPNGTIYYTYDQRPNTTISFVIRSKIDADIASRARAVMMKTDPTVPVYRQRSAQAWIDLAMTDRRAPMLIAVMYAIVSLVLAAVGIYGVITHGVVQREREIGVRMALGGTAANVFGLVLGGGVRIIAVGLAAGLAGGYAVAQLMRNLLYGAAPASLWILILAGAGLSAVALVATIVPAWRASRIDPVGALNK